MSSLAITAIGRDRPGIVAAVSRVLFDLGCNVEDSSMTLLRGNFAMMLVVACPEGTTPDTVRGALDPVCAGLQLLLSVEQVDDRAEVPRPSHVLTVYGGDKPGILFRTCDVLASLGVNITDLDSRLVGDADSLYAVILELELPSTVDPGVVTARLDEVASDVGVDIVLNDRDADIL